MAYVAAADQRILAGTAASLSMVVSDQDGEPDTGAATVTVGVTRGDGTVLVAAGTGTVATGAARTVALTRSQTVAVDRLTATWSVGGDVIARTVTDVVGAHWFGPRTLRSRAGLESLATPTLLAARDSFGDLADRVTGVAWVPRWWTETVRSTGSNVVVTEWPQIREVLSITVDGSAQTLADWDVDAGPGVLRAPFTVSSDAPIVVRYRHGYDRPPGPLVDAAIEACEWSLTKDSSGVSPRALGFSGEFGSFRYASATSDHPTGLPDVDAILATYSRRVPGLA